MRLMDVISWSARDSCLGFLLFLSCACRKIGIDAKAIEAKCGKAFQPENVGCILAVARIRKDEVRYNGKV